MVCLNHGDDNIINNLNSGRKLHKEEQLSFNCSSEIAFIMCALFKHINKDYTNTFELILIIREVT